MRRAATVFSRVVLTRRFDAVPVPAELLFHVVRDVGAYQRFVPMCSHSRVLLQRTRDDFDAELCINYRLFQESYQSRVVCGVERDAGTVLWVRSIATEGGVVNYLESLWRMRAQGAARCSIDYSVSFEFSSILYNTVTHLLKDVIAAKISSAMLEEARRKQQQMSESALRELVAEVQKECGVAAPPPAPPTPDMPPAMARSPPAPCAEPLSGVDPLLLNSPHLQYLWAKRRQG